MALLWTETARRDLQRLHDFLAPVDRRAAARATSLLVMGVRKIPRHPRLGQRLAEFEPREVRRLLIGHYEVRYEIRDRDVFVLRVWHAAEDR